MDEQDLLMIHKAYNHSSYDFQSMMTFYMGALSNLSSEEKLRIKEPVQSYFPRPLGTDKRKAGS